MTIFTFTFLSHSNLATLLIMRKLEVLRNDREIHAIAFSPNNRLLATGDHGGHVRLWRIDTPSRLASLIAKAVSRTRSRGSRLLRELALAGGWVDSVAFSPDGKIIAAGCSCDGDPVTGLNQAFEIKLWAVDTGTELGTFRVNTGWSPRLAFSPAGGILAFTAGHVVYLFDVNSGTEVRRLELKGSESISRNFYCLSFSPDGKMLATGTGDKQLILWDVKTGTSLRTLLGHDGAVDSVCISPDARVVASASRDKSVKVWDVRTGDLLRTLAGHGECVNAVVISPGSDVIASGSNDKLIRLWNARTGQMSETLSGHQQSWGVFALAYSPDGRLLASAADERFTKGLVNLWYLT